MRFLVLAFSLHFGDDRGAPDRWLSSDKAKHFFTAALVQSMSFGGLRAAGVTKPGSLVGATIVSAGFSIGKEVHDSRTGGDVSAKDLAWDAAGIGAMTLVLRRTEP